MWPDGTECASAMDLKCCNCASFRIRLQNTFEFKGGALEPGASGTGVHLSPVIYTIDYRARRF